MTVLTWNNAAGGFWDGPGWSPNQKPKAGDTCDITNTFSGAAYVVSLSDAGSAGTVNLGAANAELFIDGSLAADTINLNAGLLFLGGVISGATIVEAGAKFRAADGELDNVQWDGVLALNGGQSTSFDNTLAVSNLTLRAQSGSGAGELDITGYDAELDIKGDMTLDGVASDSSNLIIKLGGVGYSDYIKVTGSSTLTIGPNVILTADAKNANVFLEDDGSGVIDNYATLNFGSVTAAMGGSGEIEPSDFNNYGQILVNFETVDITSSGIFNGTSNVGGFDNEATGVIDLTGAKMTVHDNGTVFVDDGNFVLLDKSRLTFYNNATGDGLITLTTNSVADIWNFTGSVEFEDDTGRLLLENVTKFKGEINDFAIGNSIDFMNVGYAIGDYVTFVASGFLGGGTVSVHSAGGGVVASFVVANVLNSFHYNASEFTLNQDGSLNLVVGLTRHVVHDFNGDGLSDILWFNTTTGAANSGLLLDWTISSATTLSHASNNIAKAPAGTRIVGTGDFNDDGTSDVLLQNASGLQIWDMSNGVRLGSTIQVGGTALGSTWSVAGVGDFNGDGTSDVLWQKTLNGTVTAVQVWTILNNHYVSATSITTNLPGAGWSIKGTGDFNGDGTTDIVWGNASHELVEWRMKGGKLENSQMQAPSGSWTYAGVGDFKGDGTDEVLLESTAAAHTLTAYNMETGGSFSLGNLALPTGFSVAAIGDYNGDGISDVLLHSATGAVDIGLTNASGHITAWTSIGSLAASSWRLSA